MAGGDRLPLDLDQLVDRGLEALVGLEHRGVARRLVAEAEVAPDRHVRRAQTLHEHSVDEVLRRLRAANSASNGMTTISSTPSASTSSALVSCRVRSLGVASGAITDIGCGSKVSTVSLSAITSRWPRCTPSNIADGDAPRVERSASGRRDDVHRRAEAYDGLEHAVLSRLGDRDQAALVEQPRRPLGLARDGDPVRGAAGVIALQPMLRQEGERVAQRNDRAPDRRPATRNGPIAVRRSASV